MVLSITDKREICIVKIPVCQFNIWQACMPILRRRRLAENTADGPAVSSAVEISRSDVARIKVEGANIGG